MERTKWIINSRNKLVNIVMECDSCAAIDGTKMTPKERKELQNLIRKAVNYIDSKLN